MVFRQRVEQYFTSSQHLSHFLRQKKGLLQVIQTFDGRFALLTVLPLLFCIFYEFALRIRDVPKKNVVTTRMPLLNLNTLPTNLSSRVLLIVFNP